MGAVGWIDFSSEHRDMVRTVIDLLKNKGVADELGIGVIRSIEHTPQLQSFYHQEDQIMEFRVFRSENRSGEAFKTLSILLANIAILLMGLICAAVHPGIPIHDSPQEADLGGQIYRRLLLIVAAVADELANDDVVPFQQINTTTTSPPTTLKRKSTNCLKLASEEGQLFGRQLHSTDLTQQAMDFHIESS